MKTIKLKSETGRMNFYLCKVVFLWLFVIFIFPNFCHSAINIENVAQLHAKIKNPSITWNEGFAERVDGTVAPYPSFRSFGKRDTAIVARTTDGFSQITWNTGTIHSEINTDSVAFIWICGFGNNLGQETFYLFVDDHQLFQFVSSNQPAWKIVDKNCGTLSFTAIDTSRWGAYFGYMVLQFPQNYLLNKQRLQIKIVGAPSSREVWFRTYAYKDALHHLRENECRKFYYDLKFWNFGDAELSLATSQFRAGQIVNIYADSISLGENSLVRVNSIAKTIIPIPRQAQINLPDYLVLALDNQSIDSVYVGDVQELRIKEFLTEELICDQYIFPPGEFPKLHWKRPGIVENQLGKFQLKVTYYNQQMMPVEVATEAGRYAAVVEGTTPSGFTLRRFITLFSAPDEIEDVINLDVNKISKFGIAAESIAYQSQTITDFFQQQFNSGFRNNPDAAVFLAGLAEIVPEKHIIDSPQIVDRQWWIDFKRTVFNLPPQTKTLLLPREKKTKAVPKILTEYDSQNSKYQQNDLDRIDEVCREWVNSSNEPLATLVAHKGQIVFFHAYGTIENGKPMTMDTPTWMASITKLVTGILMMMFIDQGLVNIDDPIDVFLPELRDEHNPKLTIRHLFTHTNGFGWHDEWGSDWNPALENYIAQCLPYLKIGNAIEYNRLGYAVAGKIMERITGIAIPYLFEDYIIQPLGMKHTFVDNTYGSMYSTCKDMAQLAMMLLNRGQYDNLYFFSEESFKKFLPAKLDKINPDLNREWGLGTVWLRGSGLSDFTFGHEAASGAIFRIDLKNELIIISARNKIGSDYELYSKFVDKLIEACTIPIN